MVTNAESHEQQPGSGTPRPSLVQRYRRAFWEGIVGPHLYHGYPPDFRPLPLVNDYNLWEDFERWAGQPCQKPPHGRHCRSRACAAARPMEEERPLIGYNVKEAIFIRGVLAGNFNECCSRQSSPTPVQSQCSVPQRQRFASSQCSLNSRRMTRLPSPPLSKFSVAALEGGRLATPKPCCPSVPAGRQQESQPAPEWLTSVARLIELQEQVASFVEVSKDVEERLSRSDLRLRDPEDEDPDSSDDDSDSMDLESESDKAPASDGRWSLISFGCGGSRLEPLQVQSRPSSAKSGALQAVEASKESQPSGDLPPLPQVVESNEECEPSGDQVLHQTEQQDGKENMELSDEQKVQEKGTKEEGAKEEEKKEEEEQQQAQEHQQQELEADGEHRHAALQALEALAKSLFGDVEEESSHPASPAGEEADAAIGAVEAHDKDKTLDDMEDGGQTQPEEVQVSSVELHEVIRQAAARTMETGEGERAVADDRLQVERGPMAVGAQDGQHVAQLPEQPPPKIPPAEAKQELHPREVKTAPKKAHKSARSRKSRLDARSQKVQQVPKQPDKRTEKAVSGHAVSSPSEVVEVAEPVPEGLMPSLLPPPADNAKADGPEDEVQEANPTAEELEEQQGQAPELIEENKVVCAEEDLKMELGEIKEPDEHDGEPDERPMPEANEEPEAEPSGEDNWETIMASLGSDASTEEEVQKEEAAENTKEATLAEEEREHGKEEVKDDPREPEKETTEDEQPSGKLPLRRASTRRRKSRKKSSVALPRRKSEPLKKQPSMLLQHKAEDTKIKEIKEAIETKARTTPKPTVEGQRRAPSKVENVEVEAAEDKEEEANTGEEVAAKQDAAPLEALSEIEAVLRGLTLRESDETKEPVEVEAPVQPPPSAAAVNFRMRLAAHKKVLELLRVRDHAAGLSSLVGRHSSGRSGHRRNKNKAKHTSVAQAARGLKALLKENGGRDAAETAGEEEQDAEAEGGISRGKLLWKRLRAKHDALLALPVTPSWSSSEEVSLQETAKILDGARRAQASLKAGKTDAHVLSQRTKPVPNVLARKSALASARNRVQDYFVEVSAKLAGEAVPASMKTIEVAAPSVAQALRVVSFAKPKKAAKPRPVGSEGQARSWCSAAARKAALYAPDRVLPMNTAQFFWYSDPAPDPPLKELRSSFWVFGDFLSPWRKQLQIATRLRWFLWWQQSLIRLRVLAGRRDPAFRPRQAVSGSLYRRVVEDLIPGCFNRLPLEEALAAQRGVVMERLRLALAPRQEVLPPGIKRRNRFEFDGLRMEDSYVAELKAFRAARRRTPSPALSLEQCSLPSHRRPGHMSDGRQNEALKVHEHQDALLDQEATGPTSATQSAAATEAAQGLVLEGLRSRPQTSDVDTLKHGQLVARLEGLDGERPATSDAVKVDLGVAAHKRRLMSTPLATPRRRWQLRPGEERAGSSIGLTGTNEGRDSDVSKDPKLDAHDCTSSTSSSFARSRSLKRGSFQGRRTILRTYPLQEDNSCATFCLSTAPAPTQLPAAATAVVEEAETLLGEEDWIKQTQLPPPEGSELAEAVPKSPVRGVIENDDMDGPVYADRAPEDAKVDSSGCADSLPSSCSLQPPERSELVEAVPESFKVVFENNDKDGPAYSDLAPPEEMDLQDKRVYGDEVEGGGEDTPRAALKGDARGQPSPQTMLTMLPESVKLPRGRYRSTNTPRARGRGHRAFRPSPPPSPDDNMLAIGSPTHDGHGEKAAFESPSACSTNSNALAGHMLARKRRMSSVSQVVTEKLTPALRQSSPLSQYEDHSTRLAASGWTLTSQNSASGGRRPTAASARRTDAEVKEKSARALPVLGRASPSLLPESGTIQLAVRPSTSAVDQRPAVTQKGSATVAGRSGAAFQNAARPGTAGACETGTVMCIGKGTSSMGLVGGTPPERVARVRRTPAPPLQPEAQVVRQESPLESDVVRPVSSASNGSGHGCRSSLEIGVDSYPLLFVAKAMATTRRFAGERTKPSSPAPKEVLDTQAQEQEDCEGKTSHDRNSEDHGKNRRGSRAAEESHEDQCEGAEDQPMTNLAPREVCSDLMAAYKEDPQWTTLEGLLAGLDQITAIDDLGGFANTLAASFVAGASGTQKEVEAVNEPQSMHLPQIRHVKQKAGVAASPVQIQGMPPGLNKWCSSSQSVPHAAGSGSATVAQTITFANFTGFTRKVKAAGRS